MRRSVLMLLELDLSEWRVVVGTGISSAIRTLMDLEEFLFRRGG